MTGPQGWTVQAHLATVDDICLLIWSVSQLVLYIFSSRLGLISDVWPHRVASNQHDNPMHNHDKQ